MTEQEKAALSRKRGAAAATIKDPEQRRKFIAAQGESEYSGTANYPRLERQADDAIGTGGASEDMKSNNLLNAGAAGSVATYKNGTDYVPKTGLAMLHKGEKVIPAKENKMDAKAAMAGITGGKKPPKKIKEIRTRKTDDGKYVHTHLHHHPEHHADETHVSEDVKAAQAHLAEQEPNMSAQPPEMASPDVAAAGAPAAGPAGM